MLYIRAIGTGMCGYDAVLLGYWSSTVYICIHYPNFKVPAAFNIADVTGATRLDMSREVSPALASTAFGVTSTPNPVTHSLEIYYINRY